MGQDRNQRLLESINNILANEALSTPGASSAHHKIAQKQDFLPKIQPTCPSHLGVFHHQTTCGRHLGGSTAKHDPAAELEFYHSQMNTDSFSIPSSFLSLTPADLSLSGPSLEKNQLEDSKQAFMEALKNGSQNCPDIILDSSKQQAARTHPSHAPKRGLVLIDEGVNITEHQRNMLIEKERLLQSLVKERAEVLKSHRQLQREQRARSERIELDALNQLSFDPALCKVAEQFIPSQDSMDYKHHIDNESTAPPDNHSSLEGVEQYQDTASTPSTVLTSQVASATHGRILDDQAESQKNSSPDSFQDLSEVPGTCTPAAESTNTDPLKVDIGITSIASGTDQPESADVESTLEGVNVPSGMKIEDKSEQRRRSSSHNTSIVVEEEPSLKEVTNSHADSCADQGTICANLSTLEKLERHSDNESFEDGLTSSRIPTKIPPDSGAEKSQTSPGSREPRQPKGAPNKIVNLGGDAHPDWKSSCEGGVEDQQFSKSISFKISCR